uniref:Small ribosomal subunit protein bS20c n=1 Tax=Scinaia undulata TaxID=1884664 RepID=A0A1G4NXG6_9FLOR|nr:Ribosomal protein S20 [Scinaia undulata]SCW23393.1 Ribosomal protein S20 [Scinaia undulata]
MAKKLSVIKSIAVAERNRYFNKVYKSNIRTLTKKFLYLAGTKRSEINTSKEELQILLAAIYSRIDKAVKKGVLHRNSASRKKSVLAKALNS